MINTRLIMVEGIVGSGKSTTAEYLAEKIEETGVKVVLYREYAQDHPLDFYISRLLQDNYGRHFDISSVVRMIQSKDPAVETLTQWEEFSKICDQGEEVIISESRFWQHETMTWFLCGIDPVEIIERQQEVIALLSVNRPCLVYLANDDVVPVIEKAFTERPMDWQQWVTWMFAEFPYLKTRNLTGKDGIIEFYKAWNLVAEELFERFPFSKVALRNPHDNWQLAYEKLNKALDLSLLR